MKCCIYKLTPGAFEKHFERDGARKWKNYVWVINQGQKVPISKTKSLLKYYDQAPKNGKGFRKPHTGPGHRDEFVCYMGCNKMRRGTQQEQEDSGNEQHAENRGTQIDQVEHGKAQQNDREHEKSPTEQVPGETFLVSGDVVCDTRQPHEVYDSRQPREDGNSRQTRGETREEEGIHQTESVAAADLLVTGDVGWVYRQNREQTESVATAVPPPHIREEDWLILRNRISPFSERGGSTSESLSHIHKTSVGLNIADSEAEKVLHLLVQKQQVKELESKPPDPTSLQSSNWSDMIEEEVEDQLQSNKERYKPQWQLQSHIPPATRSRSRSRTKGREE
ncbi:hypothetical protein IFM89_000490 [Coptis chinensis]|uniref:ULTRAPETALA1/2 SAND domain-containing protein n=1 Tax=Coptis chinensis TaxID=261450 RepID=A0A835H0B5_9MAGN|nr:hypothetical protein IFM89_000490 [Coptis chinensis]